MVKKRQNWNTKRLKLATKVGKKYIVGIDEVGRGPLAGPITFCAFLSSVDVLLKYSKDKKFVPGGNDSKKLKAIDREMWRVKIEELAKENKWRWSLAHGTNKDIDKKGLAVVIKKCLESALTDLKIKSSECHILLDGGLHIDKKYRQETIVKGDEKELAIALSSILAKVERDNLIVKLAKKYPKYSFEKHKGYGTKTHCEAIKKYGPCSIHRRSFLKKLVK
ncbi:MAG: ribonuclease HII [Minisyncoccia bacterium]